MTLCLVWEGGKGEQMKPFPARRHLEKRDEYIHDSSQPGWEPEQSCVDQVLLVG